jgi:DNA-binding PadR family transcriptional regulator
LTARRRLSSEYTMFSILEYLCINATRTPISKYHIITKVPGIKQQRKDRVLDIMLTLEKQGLISSIKTSDSTFYYVTEKGAEAYSRWVKSFLNFTRLAYGIEEDSS